MVGNLSHYRDLDVLRTFLYLDQAMSRNELVNALEMGEGTVRSILDLLKNKDLIMSTQTGHALSSKGQGVLNDIKKIITKPHEVNIHIFTEHMATALVYHADNMVKVDYKLRDEAVKNGAEGALIMNHHNGKLCFEFDCTIGFDYLLEKFEMKEDELIIVAFGDTKRNIETAALAVAVKVDDKLKEIVKMFQ